MQAVFNGLDCRLLLMSAWVSLPTPAFVGSVLVGKSRVYQFLLLLGMKKDPRFEVLSFCVAVRLREPFYPDPRVPSEVALRLLESILWLISGC